MKQEDSAMVEKIMDTGTMAYAYVYPFSGGPREEYFIASTPENLANFIGGQGYDARQIIVTDFLDRLIVDTSLGMLETCPDQELCQKIISHLAPIQMGEKEAGEVLAVDRNAADQYFAEEDQAVTMAEYQML